MRASEVPPRVYYVHACYACGEQVDVESARGRNDMEVMGTFAPRHKHDAPHDGPPVWVGCGVKEVVERNEFTRVQGERDVALAKAAHWEGCSRNEVGKKRRLHAKYNRLFRRSLRGRALRLRKLLRRLR